MLEKVSILAVLVLYRRALAESVTWNALASQVDGQLHETIAFRVLICENGPLETTHALPALPQWAEYVGIRENHGLAWAYNLGLKRAEEYGAGWLLTLDQDTALPPDFLVRMAAAASQLQGASAASGRVAAAVVPQLVSQDGMTLSPSVVSITGERAVESGLQGWVDGDARAYNSGALVRVEALEKIGGYDRRFWLDYLDHALFHALHVSGGWVWMQGDVQAGHRLSLHDDRAGLGEERFRNFSAAESVFSDLYASRLQGLLFTVRLILRILNQRRRGDAEHFSRTTCRVLKQRLLLRRRERIVGWEAGCASMASEPEIASELRGHFPFHESPTDVLP